MASVDYDSLHYCPVHKRIVTPDECYESGLGLSDRCNIDIIPELEDIKDIEWAKPICRACDYN